MGKRITGGWGATGWFVLLVIIINITSNLPDNIGFITLVVCVAFLIQANKVLKKRQLPILALLRGGPDLIKKIFKEEIKNSSISTDFMKKEKSPGYVNKKTINRTDYNNSIDIKRETKKEAVTQSLGGGDMQEEMVNAMSIDGK